MFFGENEKIKKSSQIKFEIKQKLSPNKNGFENRNFDSGFRRLLRLDGVGLPGQPAKVELGGSDPLKERSEHYDDSQTQILVRYFILFDTC